MATYWIKLLPLSLCKRLGCARVHFHRKPACVSGSRIPDWKGWREVTGLEWGLNCVCAVLYIRYRKCPLSSSKNGMGKATELWGPKSPPEKTLSTVHMFIEVVVPALPPHRAGAALKNASLGSFPPRTTCSWIRRWQIYLQGPGPGVLEEEHSSASNTPKVWGTQEHFSA